MVFWSDKVKFDNGETMQCRKVILRSEKYVVLLSNANAYEMYHHLGAKISPENCTYIAKGAKANQIIIGMKDQYQVYTFNDNSLEPLYFYSPLDSEEPVRCVNISVLGTTSQGKAIFRYLLTLEIDHQYRNTLASTNGGNFLFSPDNIIDIRACEAGYIVEDTSHRFGMFNFQVEPILPFQFDHLECRYDMILAEKNEQKMDFHVPSSIHVSDCAATTSYSFSKVGAFDYSGKEILPIAYKNIRAFYGILIADIWESQNTERFFHFYHKDGSPIYEGNCISYEFVEGTYDVILSVKNIVSGKVSKGVVDTITDTVVIPIQHQKIQTREKCFVVSDELEDGETQKEKIVQIMSFTHKDLLVCEGGYDEVHFLPKYIVAEKEATLSVAVSDNSICQKKMLHIQVVDYEGKLLAKTPISSR